MQRLPRLIRRLTDEEAQAIETASVSAKTPLIEFMEIRVFDLSTKAAGAGDERLADTYRFVAGVLRPPLKQLARVDASMDPFFVTPASLTDEETHLLCELVDQFRDPELRARFADYVWLRMRDRRFGEIAVDEYLASALRLRDPEAWTGCADRYARAAAVAASLGKKNERYIRTIETIEECLAELNGTDPLFLSERLMSILLDQKLGDATRYAALAEKCALAAEQRGNFYLALYYWKVQLRWYVALKDSDGQRRSRLAAAESVISDGESRTKGEQPGFLNAADFLQRGIAMLIKAGAPQQRIDEVNARLREYQAKGVGELKPHTVTFDASEMINEARAAVAGKPLSDAIMAFVKLLHLPTRDRVRREVLRRAKAFPFSHLFADIKLNSEGAGIAGRGSVTGDEEEETDNVLALMYDDVTSSFSIQAQAMIAPAWRQIQDEHEIREADMAVLVGQSWFIPPDLELFFAKGLAAGFNGDLISAIHLLVPHVEGVLRWNLQRIGVRTMQPNRDGYHEERDLNQLLAMPKSRQLLGDSAQFALTALLTSRFGCNLRNNLAHSLVTPEDCESTVALFFWALILKFCVSTQPRPEAT